MDGEPTPFVFPDESSTVHNTPSEKESESTSNPEAPASEQQDGKADITMRISIKSADVEIIYKLNGSQAAKELYGQLPLTTEVEPFSNNEMTFYPPKKLSTEDASLSGGEAGSLSYYVPWGDVVMFYAPCSPNSNLYELGTVVSGKEDISKLTGNITITACKD